MTSNEKRKAPVKVVLVRVPTEDVRMLVEELDAELGRHYPPEQRHGLKLDAIFKPHIRFFVAYANGKAAGCGGIAFVEGFGEIKRMYVRPEARGLGVADGIVHALEQAARAQGFDLLRLETGTEQHAAMRFYTRHGFARCEAFEPYASMGPDRTCTSLFFEKRLLPTT